MRGICERCGTSFEAKRPSKRFCGRSSCRAGKRSVVTAPAAPAVEAVGDALRVELEKLEVADSYEGQVALGIARQLDNGTVAGAAYASLSKELDRRVDALRLKAEKADDPTRVVKGRFAEKRAALAG